MVGTVPPCLLSMIAVVLLDCCQCMEYSAQQVLELKASMHGIGSGTQAVCASDVNATGCSGCNAVDYRRNTQYAKSNT